jgi:hypothetical protein
MDRIDAISGISAALAGAEPSRLYPTQRPGGAAPGMAEPPAPFAPAGDRPDGPIRASRIGANGRFEKFILAVQALHLGQGAQEPRTERTERLRAAAEEIFSIDGVPEMMPAGGGGDVPAPHDGAPEADGDPGPALATPSPAGAPPAHGPGDPAPA